VRQKEDGSMTTALVAVLAATLVAVLALISALRTKALHERAFEDALAALHEHVGSVSTTLERAVERAAAARASGVSRLELTIRVDELVSHAAAEVARLANARAAVVQVEGPHGEAVVAASGPGDARALLERIPLPPDAQPFRALTIAWMHGHGPTAGELGGSFRSALVVPIVEEAARSGIVVAFATEVDAFGPERVDALERLARDVARSLESSRRLARMKLLASAEPGNGRSFGA
jgi:GAF domain-containing protein